MLQTRAGTKCSSACYPGNSADSSSASTTSTRSPGCRTRRPCTRPSTLFFFQAEDGIRDYKVTGVQTCALPIFTDESHEVTSDRRRVRAAEHGAHADVGPADRDERFLVEAHARDVVALALWHEIGRASCRERV